MLSKSILILLSGKAGVGKSTVADIMRCYILTLGYKPFIAPFAYGVKQTARSSFGWDGEKDEKGRLLLQNVGRTGREYNKDIWCEFTINKLIPNQPLYPFDFVLVDDWRYPNELHYVKNNFLYSTYPIRIEAPDREILKGTKAELDSSETSLPSGFNTFYWSHIYNLGTIDQLANSAKKAIDLILELEKFERKEIK